MVIWRGPQLRHIYFTPMVYLQTNTADQHIYLTLDEARQYYSTPYSYYLLVLIHDENSSAGVSLSQVADIVAESQRITHLLITTVSLDLAGRYRYYVYGQTSSTNTDVNDASVVGLAEQGYVVLTDSTVYYDVPTNNMTNDIVYDG